LTTKKVFQNHKASKKISEVPGTLDIPMIPLKISKKFPRFSKEVFGFKLARIDLELSRKVDFRNNPE
jgi:hypothetical protein